MTVLEIGDNKLVINLTHTEVLCCFDSYERLNTLSGSVKAAISVLIEGVAESHSLLKGGKITARIRATFNKGCEITVIRKTPARKSGEKIYIMDFADSEALTGAVILLYRRSGAKRLESSIYRIPNGYRLAVKAKTREALFGADEFYGRLTVLETAEREPLGRELIGERAIEKFGRCFYRDFK